MLIVYFDGRDSMNIMVAELGRKVIILVGQTFMILAALIMAVYLHYEGDVPESIATGLVSIFLPLVVIKLTSFGVLRLFSGWWRYVSIPDLVTLVKANLLGTALFVLYCTYAPVPVRLSWSVFAIDGLLCFLLMSGARVAVRMGREYACSVAKSCGSDEKRVVIVGAGAIGQSVVREVRQNPNLRWRVLGYIDQDAGRQKQYFQGVQVLGDIDGLSGLLRHMAVDQVIMACHALNGNEMRQVVATCHKFGVKSLILPNVGEILDENISVNSIRDVRLEDLLGRPPIHLEINEIRRYLAGKKIMVTGAAGSIGREICRQVADFGATSIMLFDNAETPLFNVERDLKAQFPAVDFTASLSDVRNLSQVNGAFDSFSPHVVFHAAAYKHVPMSEQNPLAAVENNVIGSRNLADAACRHRIERFVMVSTDKAVNPTNVMGASKRAAEIYVQALARKSATNFVTVRFGNVLGSNGSVVPIFQEQVRNGGPVTVTDPDATRFFMTIPEAVQLVLQAGSMGQGGEIFILNMGEQIRIIHLAEELIRLSGMTPYRDIDIVFTGLRPGEKLHEELLLDDEDVKPTSHEKICVARACRYDFDTLHRQFNSLALACQKMERDDAIYVLKGIVPEYCAVNRPIYKPVGRVQIIPQPQMHIPYAAAETA
jgi:FlaA1/EpsC-like NDP-sugar epimerase